MARSTTFAISRRLCVQNWSFMERAAQSSRRIPEPIHRGSGFRFRMSFPKSWTINATGVRSTKIIGPRTAGFTIRLTSRANRLRGRFAGFSIDGRNTATAKITAANTDSRASTRFQAKEFATASHSPIARSTVAKTRPNARSELILGLGI